MAVEDELHVLIDLKQRFPAQVFEPHLQPVRHGLIDRDVRDVALHIRPCQPRLGIVAAYGKPVSQHVHMHWQMSRFTETDRRALPLLSDGVFPGSPCCPRNHMKR